MVSFPLFAKVDPPNYNFSLDKFESFMPGKNISEVPKDFGQGKIAYKNGDYLTYRYYISHIRYKFIVLVQAKKGIITDFHARLPHYFLHDIFHQSLINRYGKQNLYQLKNSLATYIWKNVQNNLHTYSSTCTITCFPISYAVESNQQNDSSFKSVYSQLIENEASRAGPK